jgi:predicted amidophosphoribosyltransferase
MRIFGCPACWPSLDGRPPRLCPVCGGEIPPEGYAVARYFERPGRKHVHVLGCSRCRPGA